MGSGNIGKTLSDSVAPNGQFSWPALFLPPLRERFTAIKTAQALEGELQNLQTLGSIGKAARDTGDTSVMRGTGEKVGDIYGQQAIKEAPMGPGNAKSTLRVAKVVGAKAEAGAKANIAARRAAGLGEAQIERSGEQVSNLQQGLTELGVPAGVAAAIDVSNASDVAARASEQATYRQTQAENNFAAMERQQQRLTAQARQSAARVVARPEKDDPRKKLVFDLTKRLLPPTKTGQPFTTVNPLTGAKETKIATVERPITPGDIRKATRQAERTVDRIYGSATPGRSNGVTPEVFKQRSRARKRAGDLAAKGLALDDSSLAAVSEQAGVHEAFRLPPITLDPTGNVADAATIAADMVARWEKVAKFHELGIGGVREIIPDDAAMKQFVVDLLIDAGVPDAQIPALFPLIAAEAKRRGL